MARATRREGGERLDIDELREQIRDAIEAGDEDEMRDLARLAIAAFGRQGEGSGVVGVDVQRIRRTLGLSAGAQPPTEDGATSARRSTATSSTASSATCAASSNAT